MFNTEYEFKYGLLQKSFRKIKQASIANQWNNFIVIDKIVLEVLPNVIFTKEFLISVGNDNDVRLSKSLARIDMLCSLYDMIDY